MWLYLLALSVLFLAGALWLARRAARGRQRAGLPAGRLVYADTGRWSAVARSYFSRHYRLTGRPDYLVDTSEGLVPVEVKRTAAPAAGRAYESHVMQLAAYCLLIEEAHGHPPPYGLIHYADATVQIDYTPELRDALLELLGEMRQTRLRRNVRRSHQEPARCHACGLRHACGREALSG